MAARLRELYQKTVVPALTKDFGYKNPMAVPKVEKVSLNVGLGEATGNSKLMDGAVNELSLIAGCCQLAVIRQAGGIAVDRVAHAEGVSLLRHHVGEFAFVTADGLGDDDSDVIGRFGDHRSNRIFNGDSLAGPQPQLGRSLHGRVLGHR